MLKFPTYYTWVSKRQRRCNMRSKIICLLLALCFVLSLTACRKTDSNSGGSGNSAGDNMGQQNEGSSGNASGGSTVTDGSTEGGLVEDAVEGAKDSARSFSRTMTDDFDRMMDNARVRDSDGILTDGENPTHKTLR